MRLRAINTGIDSVVLPVDDINILIASRDQILHLIEVEHLEHVHIDDTGNAALESHDLVVNLPIELVVGEQVNVLDLVVVGHWYVLAAGLELDETRATELVQVDGEVELELFHVASVVFEHDEVLVDLWVQ